MGRERRLLGVPALAVCLAIASGGCGDDDDAGDVTGESDSAARYCSLVQQADRAGNRFFAAIEANPNATPADYRAAERRFVEQNASLFNDLADAAPEEIATEVETLIAGQRARAGLGPRVPAAEVNAAEQRIAAYESEAC